MGSRLRGKSEIEWGVMMVVVKGGAPCWLQTKCGVLQR